MQLLGDSNKELAAAILELDKRLAVLEPHEPEAQPEPPAVPAESEAN